MNKHFFKTLPLMSLSLAFAFTIGCSTESAMYSGNASAERSSIPPKTNNNSNADMAGEASDGEDIPDKPEEEASQFWIQFSTDDSTSMASAQLHKSGRSFGGLPHEFVNYYDAPAHLFDEETWGLQSNVTNDIRLGLKAAEGNTVDVFVEDTSEDAVEQFVLEERGTLDVLFQMQADVVEHSERRNWNLFYCVDVSGSMGGSNMRVAKRALENSLAHMKTGDRVSLVTFGSNATLIFENLEYTANADTIREAFASLQANGSTNMIAGLNLAYDLAQTLYSEDEVNRVMLFSDGAANVGTTDIANFESLTRMGDSEGIYLSGVGVGSNYDQERMDRLTDAGKGAHVYLPNLVEADLIFGDYFSKLVEVAADQVAIEMLLPTGLSLAGFSGEEVSFDPEQRLQNIVLAAGDDMTFTARFIVYDEDALNEAATLRITLRPLSTGEEQIVELDVERFSDLISAPGDLFERTQAISDFAKIVTGAGGETRSPADLQDALNNMNTSDWGIAEVRDLAQNIN